MAKLFVVWFCRLPTLTEFTDAEFKEWYKVKAVCLPLLFGKEQPDFDTVSETQQMPTTIVKKKFMQ